MRKFKIQKIFTYLIPLLLVGASCAYAAKLSPEDVILSAAGNLFSDVEIWHSSWLRTCIAVNTTTARSE